MPKFALPIKKAGRYAQDYVPLSLEELHLNNSNIKSANYFYNQNMVTNIAKGFNHIVFAYSATIVTPQTNFIGNIHCFHF